MQEEHAKIKEMQSEIERNLSTVAENQEEIDSRSIYVGNVDYGSVAEELENHFKQAGDIIRITIKSDKMGNPKGFAYIEFKDKSSVENALQLNGSTFRNRELKVFAKRTNIPGLSTTTRGRGRGRGAPRGAPRGGFVPRGGRGRGGRGRGRGGGPY
ncbi:predicted protein [Naegleria gruberi]|uniref:Predicted protein n=1 Tax=Naegleria gruberi TaxID=5762 RepID=D2VM18_NAEGR|nr:uncharacterized protein NAEGRDRAFT_80501 [Naegleria gruberi]EFC42148.1 predicted protein [Naegleria gruberi]|eukprot:XP_002674892.1 predicted protein [Naegleria gruberi strain NEG-M]